MPSAVPSLCWSPSPPLMRRRARPARRQGRSRRENQAFRGRRPQNRRQGCTHKPGVRRRVQTQAAKTPVTFAVAAQAGRCQVLTLTLNDLQLSLLGLNVDLSEVNLRIFAVAGDPTAAFWAALLRAVSQHGPVGRGASTAHAQKVVRALNSRLQGSPDAGVPAQTRCSGTTGDASAAQAGPAARCFGSCSGRST